MMSLFTGIPSEVWVGLVSAVLGGWTKIQSMKLQRAEAEHRMLMERAGAQVESADAAANRDTTDWGKAVRRITLLVVVCYLFGWPMIAGIMDAFGHSPATWYVWSQEGGGFWPFGKGERMYAQLFTGFVMTPLHSHTAYSIIYFYFGAAIAGARKR